MPTINIANDSQASNYDYTVAYTAGDADCTDTNGYVKTVSLTPGNSVSINVTESTVKSISVQKVKTN